MKEKFTPLSCAKMEIDGKLPRSSLQNLRKVEPRIFPALHSFDKMKKYLIHAFEIQPEKTEKGWKLPIKQFISFLITKVYEVQPQDKIIFSFSFDATTFGKKKSLLAAIRMISHHRGFQSPQDLYVVYRGWCSDDKVSGGAKEMQKISQDILDMQTNDIIIEDKQYRVRFKYVFDLKSMWCALNKGGAKEVLFCTHCNTTSSNKLLMEYQDEETGEWTEIKNPSEEILRTRLVRPKKFPIVDKNTSAYQSWKKKERF